jgi:Ferritin-like domain
VENGPVIPGRFLWRDNATQARLTSIRRASCELPALRQIISHQGVMAKISKFIARSKTAAPLETPTDLSQDAVTTISQALNRLLADTYALYLKTKNFHWHVSGPHFRSYHLLFDEQAKELFDTTDELAERVRKLGGTTIPSISENPTLAAHQGQ